MLVVQRLGERWPGRNRQEGEEAVEVLGSVRDELAVPAHHGWGAFEVPQRWPPDDLVYRVKLEEEGRDDTEVAAAAPQRPEQIRVLALTRGHEAAVSKYDVGLQQVIDREPVLPGQVAQATSQRQPANAGRRDEAGGRRQPESVGSMVDLAPSRSTLDSYGLRLGVDPDAVHIGQVDDHTSIATSQ